MTSQVTLSTRRNSGARTVTAGLAAIIDSGLDVKTFVENFDVLVDAAGSTKHLKELVLQLAVRGGLSGPTTEAPDALLAELQHARTKLVKAGVRAGSPSPPVPDDEAPYHLPSGWRWIRLRDLGGFLGGGTPAKSNSEFWTGPFPWVSPKDMKRPYINDSEDHISAAALESSAVKLIPERSLLYVVRGMILAHSFPVAVTTRAVTINQDMKALVLAMPELAEFVLRSCQAARTRVLAKVERSSHGTCRLDSQSVEMLPIALPPLAEQRRIVAKVDQLMALCDELEVRQVKKRETGTRLTKSALGALTSAEGPGEFNRAWTRVVENFHLLVDRAEKMSELRKAVFSLACRGSLTPRYSGSGVSILKDVRERRRLWADEQNALGNREAGRHLTKLEGQQFAPPKGDIPANWAWATLLSVCWQLVDCHNKTAPYAPSGVPLVRTSNIRDGRIRLDEVKYVTAETYTRWSRRCPPQPGDILFTREAPMGEAGLVEEKTTICMGQRMMLLRTFPDLVDPGYLLLTLRDPAFQERLINAAVGSTVKHLRVGDVEALFVPVPPIEEQRAIVARVKQLLMVCDELESRLRRSEERAAKLVEAVVQELVA